MVASIAAFAWTDASWWWFGLLLLAPDLGMLAYLAGARWGATGYNLFHTELAPGLLALAAWWTGSQSLLPFAFVWSTHIGMDRLAGYGLKHGAGFHCTHLGLIGRRRH